MRISDWSSDVCSSDLGAVRELLVLGSDLTRQRLAEQDMHKKDRAAIERRINEQKFRSVLILEGQEEERKRIAMNIHDGIGQLITRSEEHTSELQSLMRISYAVFCLKKKKQ